MCPDRSIKIQEGVTLTIEAFSHVADHGSLKRFSDSREQSKVDQLLGSGKGWIPCYVHEALII